MEIEWLRLGSAESPLTSFIFLAVVTAVASAINSVAGGGTILTFPVLAAILPAGPSQLVIANVTSKIGLWPGALAAAWEYRHERRDQPPWAVWLLLPSLLGSLLGTALIMVLPPALTGVDCPIAVLYSKDFPTGSHKVGAAYSVLVEKELFGEVQTDQHTLVWPSTGNYGIGGAWVGCRMDFDCLVVLPELMSQERFDMIESYGARVIRTPGWGRH